MLESIYSEGLSKIRKCRHKKGHHKWCPGPESNRYAYSAQDFKSCVSTNFTTRAFLIWRPESESNRRSRSCSPLHDHSAIRPSIYQTSFKWSGKRGSNSRPQPWQGCALPLSYSRVSKDGAYSMHLNFHVKEKI